MKPKGTVSNVKLNTGYGVVGVEITLNLQELFQLLQRADSLGQLIGWLQDRKELQGYTLSQLLELKNFLEHILVSAGFVPRGLMDIFKPVQEEIKGEEEVY